MDQGDKVTSDGADDCLQGEAVDILAVSTKTLVAIGAAAALNCHVCIRHLIPAALTNGILAEEVVAALVVAREIRARTGAMTDSLSDALIESGQAGANGAELDTKCC